MTRWSSVLLAFALGATGAAGGIERYTFEKPCMGTLFRVAIYSDRPETEARAAADAAFAIAARWDATLSDYSGDTNPVGKFNYAPVGVPQAVGVELLDVLDKARSLSAFTGGTFDPTAGALSWHWRLARRTGELADSETMEAARASVGFGMVEVDREHQTLARLHPMTRLDFGAIGKGYAADQMLGSLRASGFPSASVTAGGDVRVGAPPPGADGWEIEIRPWGRRSDAPLVLSLANAAVSTSGDAEQSIEIGGVRYSHILDPETGLGLRRPQAACVVAPTATESDALATAAVVAGRELAAKIASRRGCACALFDDPTSPEATFQSPNFSRWLRPPAPISH